MLIAIPPPYDFERSMARFRWAGEDVANRYLDGALYRVVDGVELRIAPVAGGVEVEPPDGRRRPAVEHLLGLRFDLAAFARAARAEPVLGPIVAAQPGLRPPLVPDPFEALVTSISAQQVSLVAARAVRNRLVERLGEAGVHAVAFPRRERVAAASEAELVGFGFTRRKAECLLELARSPLDLDALATAPDEEVRAALTALRGIGPWTAEWFLARHLGRPRAWPAGDLALRKAVDRFYGCEVHELGRRLDPHQNLAAHYLLAALRTL